MLAQPLLRMGKQQCRLLSMYPAAIDVQLSRTVNPAELYIPTISSSSLPNGASVIARHSRADSVSLKFAINSGSRNELFPEKGSAHLLAHAAFAGTQKESGLHLTRSLENHGITFGVSANREQIVYSITTPPEFLDFAVEKISDAIFSPPKFSHSIEERKSAAALDYETLKSSPQTALTELLHEAAYGDGTPLGSSLFASDLKKLDVDAVMEFRLRNFKASNLVIAGEGLALSALQSSLSHYLPSKEANPVPRAPSAFTGGSVRVRADLGGDTHLAIAFPSKAGLAGKAYAVLREVLSSRLRAAVPAGSHAGVFSTAYSDGGFLGAYIAAGSVSSAEGALGAVIKELKSIAAGPVDVTSAVNKLTLSNFLALEGGITSTAVLLSADSQGLRAEEFADVRSVTSQDVREAASALLRSNPAVAVLGATYGLQSFDSIKSSLQ